jgi:hypothetical protein
MDVASVPFTGLSQPIKEKQIIIVGGEDDISVISPLDHMLWLARHYESPKAGHMSFTWKVCFNVFYSIYHYLSSLPPMVLV